MGHKYSIPKRQKGFVEYTKEELYREYHPLFMKMLYVRGRQIMDAEDIAHNTFVYLFEIWEKIKWDQVERLISIVLYQRVVRFYQQNEKDDNKTGSVDFLELSSQGVVKDPLEGLLRSDFRRVLQDAMATLSPAEKVSFFGFYLEGKRVEELRGTRNKGTVLKLLSRARAKVSEYFSVNYPGGLD